MRDITFNSLLCCARAWEDEGGIIFIAGRKGISTVRGEMGCVVDVGEIANVDRHSFRLQPLLCFWWPYLRFLCAGGGFSILLSPLNFIQILRFP